jgi:hypothetical protein
VRIIIDTYDCDQYTALSADEVGSRYKTAIESAFPDATVVLVADGKGTRVHLSDYAPGVEEAVREDVRAILGAEWQRACEESPYVAPDAD